MEDFEKDGQNPSGGDTAGESISGNTAGQGTEGSPSADQAPAPAENGIFSERSFAEAGSAQHNTGAQISSDGRYAQPAQNVQNYIPYGGGQFIQPPPRQSAGDMYRNMYAAQQNRQPDPNYQGAQQYRQETQYEAYQPYRQYQPQYAPPVIPPVSELSETPVKKSSKAWIIFVIIAVILLLSAVMLGLAENHSGDRENTVSGSELSQGGSKGTGVTVNINVAPRPVTDDSLYRDKETGLLTTAGAAKQVLP
ncbi:MAG: hypothetical protein NC120_13685, partial [Ruminococcus sp.]|nr:hypothetical protein [Ruminococcus sp.]